MTIENENDLMEGLEELRGEKSRKNVVQGLQVHLHRKKENTGITITITRTKLGIDHAPETETCITAAEDEAAVPRLASTIPCPNSPIETTELAIAIVLVATIESRTENTTEDEINFNHSE